MSAATEDPRRLEGELLAGRYRLESWLGSGGMGAVYRAQHLTLDRPVAIKVLRPRCRQDYAHRRRFIREARVASTIMHPNVIRVFDFGSTADGLTYLAMDYLPGSDLSRRLRHGGTMDWPHARSILLQVVAGLEAAHEVGVVHRDVKPSNVFLVDNRVSQPDYVKVLDFGLAKALDPESSLAEALTMADEVMGTAPYMAPERIRGEDADARTDIYSLGVMAFRMLSGVLPLWGSGGSVQRRMMRRLKEPPPPLRSVLPEISPMVNHLVQRAMATDPANRYGSLAQLRVALQAAIVSSSSSSSTSSSGRRRPPPSAVAAYAPRFDSTAYRDTRPLSVPPSSSSSRIASSPS